MAANSKWQICVFYAIWDQKTNNLFKMLTNKSKMFVLLTKQPRIMLFFFVSSVWLIIQPWSTFIFSRMNAQPSCGTHVFFCWNNMWVVSSHVCSVRGSNFKVVVVMLDTILRKEMTQPSNACRRCLIGIIRRNYAWLICPPFIFWQLPSFPNITALYFPQSR